VFDILVWVGLCCLVRRQGNTLSTRCSLNEGWLLFQYYAIAVICDGEPPWSRCKRRGVFLFCCVAVESKRVKRKIKTAGEEGTVSVGGKLLLGVALRPLYFRDSWFGEDFIFLSVLTAARTGGAGARARV